MPKNLSLTQSSKARKVTKISTHLLRFTWTAPMGFLGLHKKTLKTKEENYGSIILKPCIRQSYYLNINSQNFYSLFFHNKSFNYWHANFFFVNHMSNLPKIIFFIGKMHFHWMPRSNTNKNIHFVTSSFVDKIERKFWNIYLFLKKGNEKIPCIIRTKTNGKN